jgi:ubiquinone/menaquinone biosynthesis C-methylase UbiE
VSPRAAIPELMDDPAVDPGELAANFDDIERANRLFGGVAPVLREVFAREPVWLLDVGCGSADIDRALLREARRRERRLEIVALDASDKVLAIARRRAGEEPFLRFVRAGACDLPFPNGAFDIVTCNLALHHFDPPEAVQALREMRRVARVTPLVCDLERSALAYFAARLFVEFGAGNRLTKHDAPVSVRRAYTKREAAELAKLAGWKTPHVRGYPFFRMMLSDGP